MIRMSTCLVREETPTPEKGKEEEEDKQIMNLYGETSLDFKPLTTQPLH